MVGSAEAVIWAAVVEFGSRVGPGCVKAVLVLSEWASGRETRAAPQTPRSGKHRKLLSGLRAFAPSPFHRIAPSLTWPPPDRSFVTTSFVHEKKPSGKPSSGKPHKPWVRALPWCRFCAAMCGLSTGSVSAFQQNALASAQSCTLYEYKNW